MDLPLEFVSYTRQLMGEHLFGQLAEGLNSTPTVSIRLNPCKSEGMRVSADIDDGRVPWCDDGHHLSTRPNFTFDPLLHAGLYYVQDASSMFLSHVLRQYVHHPVEMLDLCAAPGGKSTAALSSLPSGSFLVTNEPTPLRAQILTENIQKWGMSEAAVTNNYPIDFERNGLSFDIILTDVPCSGEGMFRKDPMSINEWSVRNVENCRTLQRQIVESAWHCLRPGGLLIYSTCTLNSRENEENVEWIINELGGIPQPVDINQGWGITPPLSGSTPYCYRFIPGVARGEGLFMSVLLKPGTQPLQRNKAKNKPRRDKGKSTGTSQYAAVSRWLSPTDDFVLRLSGNDIYAIPRRREAMYDMLQNMKVLHAGVHCAVIKGRDIVPQQSLALSQHLSKGAFAEVSLEYPDAISYLRKESVTLPPGTPRGFVLVTYKGHPLGFVKNIGNRCNNLYPTEWKIRSGHTPENQTEILIYQ